VSQSRDAVAEAWGQFGNTEEGGRPLLEQEIGKGTTY
jgi:hypothetical protein